MDLADLAAIAPLGQLVAYTALTLASITVAAVQSIVAYRNSFGWKPIILITHTKFGMVAPDGFSASYEVWNRRKYPIQVRRALTLIHSYDLHYGQKKRRAADVNLEQIVGGREFVIEPASNRSFRVDATIAKTGTSQVVLIVCRIVYFDPRKGKELTREMKRAYATDEFFGRQPQTTTQQPESS